MLSALGLVLAITGGPFAAQGLLTGANIKNGSLTGADIAARSVGASVFTASARKSLAGSRGVAEAMVSTVPPASGVRGAAGFNGPMVPTHDGRDRLYRLYRHDRCDRFHWAYRSLAGRTEP